MSWTIVHRDRWLMVVDKSSGTASQSPRGGGTNLFDELRERNQYVGLHHRLDTPASGLILFTLHKSANKRIAEGFSAHTIARGYQVVVIGDPGERGTWDQPIDGKQATTHWARLGSGGGYSALSVQLQTGRTHQIRRHAADQGFPVAGDRRYGGAAGGLWPRLALHASSLALTHPITEEALSLSAPIPEDLASLWAQALPHPDSQAP
jgi:23S rRNA-/tRNA-specific pseudouridylate synthase